MKIRFQKMLGFELRAVLYGSDLEASKPFVDLRRTDGLYTVNAIQNLVEYEIVVGKRWFRRDVDKYIRIALEGLGHVKQLMAQSTSYTENIRIKDLWER